MNKTTMHKAPCHLSLYEEIFTHSSIGMAVTDFSGQCLDVNDAMCKLVGATREQVLEQNFNRLESWKKSGLLDVALGVIEDKTERHHTVTLTTSFGSKITIDYHIIPITDEKQDRLLFIFNDITKQKQAEEFLIKSNEILEQRVIGRTAELSHKTEKLEEANIALKILVEKRKEDKDSLERAIRSNIKKLIKPYLEKIKARSDDESLNVLVGVIESNLVEITSSFVQKDKDILAKLTPMQTQVANLIQQGHTTKEIASILHLSPSTIACHRQEIRKRLSLNKEKINLRTALIAK